MQTTTYKLSSLRIKFFTAFYGIDRNSKYDVERKMPKSTCAFWRLFIFAVLATPFTLLGFITNFFFGNKMDDRLKPGTSFVLTWMFILVYLIAVGKLMELTILNNGWIFTLAFLVPFLVGGCIFLGIFLLFILIEHILQPIYFKISDFLKKKEDLVKDGKGGTICKKINWE